MAGTSVKSTGKKEIPGTSVIQTYNQFFLMELARLNPAQREAVEHIEGPVLVVAGPGTGKTHILAARIGRILMETDAQPHNILCLTFTDAGVQAMRQRLLDLIGPEAHRVHIFTFHSFCNNIIQDNLELFGKRDLEPLSDLERVEIIRHLIDELPLFHPLRRGHSDAYFYEKHLQSLFQQIKTENWTPDFIEKKIEEYLEDLPNREEFLYKRNAGSFKKGDLKQALLDDVRDKMLRLRAAARLFPRYEKLMEEHRRYDYEDMILWVLRAFREHPALLSRYQEQYLYFLVDEYQDTNGAQNEVLHRLIEFWESPNIFIVGDDDQSIYEFQGARLKNLTDFFTNYQHELKLVVLQENYRSTQHILDTSGALIRRNELRIVNKLQSLGVEKILTARSATFGGLPVHPLVAEYPDRLQEEIAIAEAIEKLAMDGFPLNEIAVIYARHRQAAQLLKLLEKKGIPCRTRRSTNILDLPMIQNLRLLLEYLQTEFHKPYAGEHWLFRILHFDIFNIQPHDLARLAIGLANISQNGDMPRWRDVIADEAFLRQLNLKNPQAFLDLSNFLEFILGEYANLSVPAFIERLINRSGLLRRILNGSPDKNHHNNSNGSSTSKFPDSPYPSSADLLQVLFTFANFVKKEADRNPRLSLSRLLDILKSMDANRIQLAVNNGGQWTGPGWQQKPGWKQQPEKNGSTNAEVNPGRVHLLTAHSSKGLEFQKVFLLDCVKDQWEPQSRSSNYQFTLPDTLTLSGEEDALEARRRLFYVGMTRAKEALQISYSRQTESEKEMQRAIFVDEILEDTEISIVQGMVPQASVLEAQALLMLESRPSVEPPETDAIQLLLENFTLSVSSMNKYLRCPLSFYYENVLRVPVSGSEAAHFGIAMHDALCRGFEKMMTTRRWEFPVPEDFSNFFEDEMSRLQGFFSRREFERRLALGRQYLFDYVRLHHASWPKKVLVEQEFKQVEVGGVPLTGIIDRLDLLDKLDVHLVDYKTGSHDPAKLRRPTENNPYGGSYWRQLVFYKLLYENWRNNPRRVVSAEISYLEPDARSEFPRRRITFEAEDVAFVKGLITDTYHKIKRQEFYEGCGKADCSWCNFLRRQAQVDSFSVEEIEGLDD
jgi:DNA helicase-2/ATP-dependent DNA helicase PcrA